jgi:hypothetical protein
LSRRRPAETEPERGSLGPFCSIVVSVPADEHEAEFRVDAGLPYRGGAPAYRETVVELSVPVEKRPASVIGPALFLVVVLVCLVTWAPNASTAITIVGMFGLVLLVYLVIRRLELSLRADVKARITIDHRSLMVSIVRKEGAAGNIRRLPLASGMTFVIDRVQHDTDVVAIARLRRGDEVIADLATYTTEQSALAAPGIATLEAALKELEREVEERELSAPRAPSLDEAPPRLVRSRSTSRRRDSSR